MDNGLNWDQVRYFVSVAQEGSAAAAAQRLGVSHATVMRNVAQLEAQLGLRLFDRMRSGYRITSDGEAVLASAKAMAQHATALVRQTAGKSPAPAGLLRLVVSDPSLFDPMPLLRDFRQQHPLIELAVEVAGQRSPARLSELDADAAILVTNAPPEELVGRQIARVHLQWFKAHATAKRRVAPTPDECEWVLWSAPGSSELSDSWQRAQLRRLTPRPRVAMQADSHAAALLAVHAGMGAALLSQVSAQALEALPFAKPREAFGVWLLTHPDLRRSGRIRALFDFVAKQSARGPGSKQLNANAEP